MARGLCVPSRRGSGTSFAPTRAAILALLVLLLSAACSPALADYGAQITVNLTTDPFGDRAYIAAPPEYPQSWLGNQVFPTTGDSAGWCLNESSGRVLQSWSSPLYSMPLVLGTEGAVGMPMVWGWIFKILLQEVIGYQTVWYDQGTTQITFYNRLVTDVPARRSDLEIQSYLQPAAPTADYLEHVQGDGSVVSRGAHSQTNQGGLYFSAAALALHPELAMESWRAWTLSDSNAQQASPLYPGGEVVQLFRNDTWEVLDEIRAVGGFADMLKENPYEPFNPANPFVCRSTMTSLDGTEFRTGCDHADYPSMYIPDQCWPNPREQCAVMFSNTPVWLGTYTQSILSTLNLSIAVAFVNVQAFSEEAFVWNSGNRKLLQYIDPTGLATNIDCTVNGRTVPCWQRVTLPLWSSECLPHYTGNFDDNYSCDYPTWSQVKYARADLATTAPRADYLLQRSDFSQTDTRAFFDLLGKQSGWPQDHKSVACAWVRENKARWASWIAAPPACSFDDTEAIVHPCDEATATMWISYEWKLPKACVGGRALPPPDEVSCPLVSASRTEQTAFLVCAAVLCAFFFALFSLRVVEILTQRRAATSTLLPSASDKKGSGSTAAPQLGCLGRLSLFGRHMPIMQLMTSSFLYFMIGLSMLAALPFVNYGPLSDARCWARYAFVMGGLTFAAQSLLMMALDTRSSLDRSLKNNARSSWAIGLRVSRILQLVILIVDACQTTLLTTKVEDAPGGGVVAVAYCAIPSVWLVAVHCTFMALWCCGNAAVMVQLLLRIHFDSLCGSTRDYTTTVRAKAARRAARATRAQKLQVDSIALSLLFGVGTALLLLWSIFLSTDPNVQLVDIVGLVGSLVGWGSLYLPSVFRARELMQPQQQSAEDKADRAAGLGGDQSDTIGNVSLVHVLSDSLLLLHFRRFAEERFDGEALHFLLSVQQFFKRLRDSTLNLTQLLEELDRIVVEFIVAGAKQQVNVSSSLRDSTLAAVDALRMHAVTLARERLKPASAELKGQARQCLQAAVSEVYQLVQWNSFPRFVASKTMVRSQKLLGWAEGFDELDEEEQSALLLRFKERQSQIRKQLIEASQTAASCSSDGEPRMQNNEAALLLFGGDGGATVAADGAGSAGTVPFTSAASRATPVKSSRARGANGTGGGNGGQMTSLRIGISPAAGGDGGGSGPNSTRVDDAPTVTLRQHSTASSNLPQVAPRRTATVAASPNADGATANNAGLETPQPHLMYPASPSAMPVGGAASASGVRPVLVHGVPSAAAGATPGGSPNPADSPSVLTLPGTPC